MRTHIFNKDGNIFYQHGKDLMVLCNDSRYHKIDKEKFTKEGKVEVIKEETKVPC